MTDQRAYPSRPFVGVGAVVFSARGVLLIRRGQPPRLGQLSLPGGAQELGETVTEAALREVKEETDLDVSIIGLVDVVDSITHDADGSVEYHYTLVDVVASTETPGAAKAQGDAAGVEWVPIEKLEMLGLWSETLRIIRKGYAMWTAHTRPASE